MTAATTRRALLGATTALAAAALPAAAAVQPDEDPIFAAIAAHQATLNTIDALNHDELPELHGLDDKTRQARVDELCDGERYALWDLFETTPRTLHGVAAVLRHLTQPDIADPGEPPILFATTNNFASELAEEWLVRLADVVAALAREAGR